MTLEGTIEIKESTQNFLKAMPKYQRKTWVLVQYNRHSNSMQSNDFPMSNYTQLSSL